MGSGEQSVTDTNTPDLRPPGSAPDKYADTTSGYHWVWLALAIMLMLSLFVLFLLPRLVSEHIAETQEQSPVTQQPAISPVGTADVGTNIEANVRESAAARSKAEQSLQRFLQLRAKLELAQADVWGEAVWSESSELAAAGDRLFAQRRFSAAAQTYNRAVHRLVELGDSRSQRFVTALNAGHRALENNETKAAQAQFELALAIEPGHTQAKLGLARTRVRDDLLRYMHTGKSAESAGNLAAARDAYTQAGQLDTVYQPARAGIERVTKLIAQTSFRAAMSRALAALDAGRLNDAGRALEQATRFKPDDSTLQDTRRRLVLARRQQKLDALRRDAFANVRKEQWQAAVTLFEKALSVDAGAGFAHEGLTRARQRVRLHRQFDHYLSDPARLYSAEPLANVEKLLSVAGTAPGNEPRLAEKIAVLKKQVVQARIPVEVQLRSDGQTSVSIYHVGHLGQFQDYQLQLRPGTYTIVGSRPGYRNVRKVIRVQPGASPALVEIRCEEPV